MQSINVLRRHWAYNFYACVGVNTDACTLVDKRHPNDYNPYNEGQLARFWGAIIAPIFLILLIILGIAFRATINMIRKNT
jgi:hypothetical protein